MSNQSVVSHSPPSRSSSTCVALLCSCIRRGDPRNHFTGGCHEVSRIHQLDVTLKFGHDPSPNHTEALSLLNVPLPESTNISETRRLVTQACVSIANWRPRLATIIRAGALGCCYIPSSLSSVTLDDVRWVPAYWDSMEDGDTSGSREKVVDPTGAGNAFMGGLGAALESGQSLRHGMPLDPSTIAQRKL